MMSEHTNLDIKDAACLHIVHMMQHPTSRPTTKSMHTSMLNDLKMNISPLQVGKYVDLTKRSTQRCHLANEGTSGLEAERVWTLGALPTLWSKQKLAAEKQRETHCLTIEEIETSIVDYVGRETAGARKWIDDAEAAVQQAQEDLKKGVNASFMNREPEKYLSGDDSCYRRQSECSCKFKQWGGWGRWGWWRDREGSAERRWWTRMGEGHNHPNWTAAHGKVPAEVDEAWQIDTTGMGGSRWILVWKQ